MKLTKKSIVAIFATMLVAFSAVFATMAYLVSEASVTNTFTMGDVDIKLCETKVDTNGVPTGEGYKEEGNEYHLIPGQTYKKDPTITVLKGSEESYVRMIVTLNKYSVIKEVFGDDFLPQNYVTGWDNATWICNTAPIVDTTKDTVSYEFRYKETVNAKEATEDIVLDALFDEFTLPGTVTAEQLEKLSDEFKIDVVGHAIQKIGFDDADTAWAAFDAQVNP